jgi:erythronate-4-phosphate dehydrogenase
MKPGAVLINTARGAVVDSQALKTAIKSGRPAATVLDVWENEPGIDAELYELATTGTAHIGGLTLDAKVRAVEMLRGALVRYVGARAEDASIAKGDSRLRGNDNWGRIGEIPAGRVTVGPGVAPLVAIAETVKTTFDIAVECGRLGRALRQANPAAAFEALRSADATRREFSAFDVAIDAAHPAAATLAALGFGVTTAIAATAPAAAGLEP